MEVEKEEGKMEGLAPQYEQRFSPLPESFATYT